MGSQRIAVSVWIAAFVSYGAASAAPPEADLSARDGRFSACLVALAPPKDEPGLFFKEASNALRTKRPRDARVLLAELSKRMRPGVSSHGMGSIGDAAVMMAEAGMLDDALKAAALGRYYLADTLVRVMEGAARDEPQKAGALFPRVLQAMEQDRNRVMLSELPEQLIPVLKRTGTLSPRGAELLAWLAAGEDAFQRDKQLAGAAEAFAKVGAAGLALRAAEAAAAPRLRAHAFIHAAQGAVEARDLTAAGRALTSAEAAIHPQKPDEFLPGLLSRVALGWHRAGNPERSRAAFAHAERLAVGLPPRSVVSSLAELSASYALAGRAGEVDRLITLAQSKAKEHPEETWQLRSFTRQLRTAGAYELALRTVDVAPADKQLDELAWLIDAVLREGRFDLALTASRKLSRPDERAAYLSVVAEAFMERGEEARALEAVYEALPGARKEDAGVTLQRLARLLVRLGRADAALATAREIPMPLLKARAMTEVAMAFSSRGDKPRALAAAKEALPRVRSFGGDPQEADMLVSFLVQVAAASGDPALARTLAKSIQHEAYRPDIEPLLLKYSPPSKVLAVLAKMPAGVEKVRTFVDLAWGQELADDTAKSLDAFCERAKRWR